MARASLLLTATALLLCDASCRPAPSAPPTQVPANAELGQASGELATTEGAREDDAKPSRFTIVDVETGKPISDAVLSVAGKESISGANGVAEVMLPFGVASHATIRHPGYVAFKGPITDQDMTIPLQPRTPATYARVVATGAAQTVRIGAVTLAIPAGAIVAGTALELGVLDARTIPEVEYRIDPMETAPFAIAQLSVDVGGHDSSRFSRVVALDKPIRVTWRLERMQFLQFGLLAPEVVFSAGAAVERMSSDGLAFDPKTNEVSFDVSHFSDVTLTQHAEISRGCDGKPTALHWWRVEHNKPPIEERSPTPGISDCSDEDRQLSITGVESETTSVAGSYATSWKINTKAETSASAALEFKLIGTGGKASAGGTLGYLYDYTRTHTGAFNFQSSRKITVTRSKTCPGGTGCVGGLYIVMEDDEVTIVHKWIAFDDLKADPEFNTPIVAVLGEKGPGSKCATLPKNDEDNKPKSVPLDRDSFEIMVKQLAKKLDGHPDYDIKSEQLIKRVHEETLHASTRRFVGSYMTLTTYQCPKKKKPGDGDGSGSSSSGTTPGTTSGSGYVEIPPPPRSKACTTPHERRRPTVVTPPTVDSLVDKKGPLPPQTETVEGTTMTVRIIAGETHSSELQEVAHAIACCPDEETKVTFASDVTLTVSAAQQGGHSHGLYIGAKYGQENDLGIDLLGFDAKTQAKIEFSAQAGLTHAWINMVQKALGRGRGSSTTITAKATKTDCAAKGLYAYLYETDYTIETEIKGSVYNSSTSVPAKLQFYGTALEGPNAVFKGHCNGGPHTTTETPPSPNDTGTPPPPDKPAKDKQSGIPKQPPNYCAAVHIGELGGFGDSFGQGELSVQGDVCRRVTQDGRFAAVVTPGWYHGPATNTFAFLAGAEASRPIDEVAPNVSVFARAEAGYALTTYSQPGIPSANAAVVMPEAGVRYRGDGNWYADVTPLSFPVFIANTTAILFRMTVSAGMNF